MVYCAGELSGLAVGMSGEIAGESVKGDGMVEAGLSVFQAMKKLLPWYSPLAGGNFLVKRPAGFAGRS